MRRCVQLVWQGKQTLTRASQHPNRELLNFGDGGWHVGRTAATAPVLCDVNCTKQHRIGELYYTLQKLYFTLLTTKKKSTLYWPFKYFVLRNIRNTKRGSLGVVPQSILFPCLPSVFQKCGFGGIHGSYAGFSSRAVILWSFHRLKEVYKARPRGLRDSFLGALGARPVACPSRGMGFHKLSIRVFYKAFIISVLCSINILSHHIMLEFQLRQSELHCYIVISLFSLSLPK